MLRTLSPLLGKFLGISFAFESTADIDRLFYLCWFRNRDFRGVKACRLEGCDGR
jgi:hypothetical protein